VNASAPYFLTITINSVNDVPVASNYNYTVSENDLLSISAPGLLANATDADLPNDTLSSVGVGTTSSRGGAVVVNANGSFTYDPRSVAALQAMIDGQSLDDTFTYFVRDAANAQSLPATVTIKVNGVNDPPVANNNTFIVPSGTTQVLRILDNDTDVDTAINPGSVTLEQLPSFGTAIVNADGTVSYRPALNYRGTDTFTYRVRDVLGAVSNIATVNILVNDPPVANNDQTYTVRNTPVDIDVLLNDRDPDGTLDPTSVTITSGPSTGTAVALSNGKIRFTPANDFVGTATLSYTVKDNVGTTSNVAQVQIQVISSSYQNPSNRLDVNADGFITAIDALIIINDLNRNGARPLVPGAFIPPPFLDTDGNNFVNSIDILQVINALNGVGEGEGGLNGEGEGSDFDVEYLGGGLVTRATVTPVSGQSMLETIGPAMARDIRSNLDSMVFGTKRSSGATLFGGNIDGNDEDGDTEDLYALLAAGDEDEDQASDELMANIDDFLL
jgi:VCBS repeat-containing protein